MKGGRVTFVWTGSATMFPCPAQRDTLKGYCHDIGHVTRGKFFTKLGKHITRSNLSRDVAKSWAGYFSFFTTRNATFCCRCRFQNWGVTREIFLATCLATFVARQVSRKIASCNMALCYWQMSSHQWKPRNNGLVLLLRHCTETINNCLLLWMAKMELDWTLKKKKKKNGINYGLLTPAKTHLLHS